MSETLTKPAADTAKADAYLRSLGLDPAEIRQQKGEADLFGGFGDGFDTFEHAGSKPSLTPEKRKQLDNAMAQMLARADKLKLAMEKRNEEPDLDKIVEEVFGHIPRNFVPPQFKKELQDWRITRDAMNDRNVQAMKESSLGRQLVENAPDALSTLTTVGSTLADGVELIKVFSPEKAELAATILSVTGAAIEMLSTAREGGETVAERMEEEESSVKQKMNDEKLIDGFSKFADAGLEIVGEFVPVIGAIQGAKATMQAMKDSAERIMLRGATGELKDRAKLRVASQLSKALEQAMSRETRLGAEAGVGVVSNAVGTAGSIATSTGVGAKVGLTLTVVGNVISVGSTAVFKGVDWSAAAKALAVLEKAQAGDEASQQEVFKHHAHYAKMLIVQLAKKTPPDAIAVQYLVDRGLTEKEIGDRSNSSDILMDYALLKSSETDAPSTFMMDVKSKLDWVASVAGKIGEGAVRFGEWSKLLKAEPKETPPSFQRAYTLDELQRMRTTFGEIEQAVADLEAAKKEVPKWLAANVANLDAAITAAALSIRQQLQTLLLESSEWDLVARGHARPGYAGDEKTALAKSDALRAEADELRKSYDIVAR